MSPNYNCRCCQEFMPSIPHWDESIGCVCAECHAHLKAAEEALAEEGIVGTFTAQKDLKP